MGLTAKVLLACCFAAIMMRVADMRMFGFRTDAQLICIDIAVLIHICTLMYRGMLCATVRSLLQDEFVFNPPADHDS